MILMHVGLLYTTCAVDENVSPLTVRLCFSGCLIKTSLVFLRLYEPEMPDCVRQACSSSAEICPSCQSLWEQREEMYNRRSEKCTQILNSIAVDQCISVFKLNGYEVKHCMNDAWGVLPVRLQQQNIHREDPAAVERERGKVFNDQLSFINQSINNFNFKDGTLRWGV